MSVENEERGSLAVDEVEVKSGACGGENWLLIVVVLFVKKLAKSLADKEVVGGGGGGVRRELKVLKSDRVFDAVLILLW